MPGPIPNKQSKLKASSSKLTSPLIEFVAQMRWQPSEAALPCNINDELLEVIARDLDVILSKHGVKNAPEALPLGLILHILKGQPGDGLPGLLLADLFAAMEDYRLEVTRELKSRRTGIPCTPATMETIFKRRGTSDRNRH